MATAKPKTASGYDAGYTLSCERALVTLLRGFGTLKGSLRLVGGLVPRYLTPERPPDVPAHGGYIRRRHRAQSPRPLRR